MPLSDFSLEPYYADTPAELYFQLDKAADAHAAIFERHADAILIYTLMRH